MSLLLAAVVGTGQVRLVHLSKPNPMVVVNVMFAATL